MSYIEIDPTGLGNYELALARIPELEVDLASAVTSLKRVQEDNGALRDIHADLVSAYKRLQEQSENVKVQLQREQDEKKRVSVEQQEEIAMWRLRFEKKTEEVMELRAKPHAAPDVEAVRRRIIEEIEEPLLQRIRALEGQLQAEKQKEAKAVRQAEVVRMELKQQTEEMKDQMAEAQGKHNLREQALERQIKGLQQELRQQADAAAAAGHLRSQLQDQEVKVSTVDKAMREQEMQVKKERESVAKDLKARIEEVSCVRQRAHQLQIKVEQGEREQQRLMDDVRAARAEQLKLRSQVEQAEARAIAATSSEDVEQLKRELAQLQKKLAEERLQGSAALKAADDRAHTATNAQRRLEIRLRDLEDQQNHLEDEFSHERELAGQEHQAELGQLRMQLEAAEHEVDKRQQVSREKERAFAQQLQEAHARTDTVTEELIQCDAAKQHVASQLLEAQKLHQQMEAKMMEAGQKRDADAIAKLLERDLEINALNDKVEHLGTECKENSAIISKLRSSLGEQEKRADALMLELAALNARFDSERARWANEADDAHASALKAEEHRRKVATEQLIEDHKRQLAKQQAAHRKATQQMVRRSQEQRRKCQRCQELASGLLQLERDKIEPFRSTHEMVIGNRPSKLQIAPLLPYAGPKLQDPLIRLRSQSERLRNLATPVGASRASSPDDPHQVKMATRPSSDA